MNLECMYNFKVKHFVCLFSCSFPYETYKCGVNHTKENLTDYVLPLKVLNAKPENVEREAEIVAQSGRLGAVTIATNMAGRGTDIILGGNAEFMARLKLREMLMPRYYPSLIIMGFF